MKMILICSKQTNIFGTCHVLALFFGSACHVYDPGLRMKIVMEAEFMPIYFFRQNRYEVNCVATVVLCSEITLESKTIRTIIMLKTVILFISDAESMEHSLHQVDGIHGKYARFLAEFSYDIP